MKKSIAQYNNVRLYTVIGYLASEDKFKSQVREFFQETDRKLEAARELRKNKRLQTALSPPMLSQEHNSAPSGALLQTARLSIFN